MKKLKTQNVYKASNNYFNSDTMTAISYDWWHYVRKIDGMVVFNAYPYSPTTQRHQSNTKRLMDELRINIDLEVETEKSLLAFDRIEELKDLERRFKRPFKRHEIEAFLDRKAFRDFNFRSSKFFGKVGKPKSINLLNPTEHDLEDALQTFARDGYGSITIFLDRLR